MLFKSSSVGQLAEVSKVGRGFASRRTVTRRAGRAHFISALEPRVLCASASTLLSYTFESTRWVATASLSVGSTTRTGASVRFTTGTGTIDTAGGATGSYGATLNLGSTVTGSWQATLDSGRLTLNNPESALAKLTFGFDLTAREVRPVIVQLTSYDSAGNRTGALQRSFTPSAADSYQRFSAELSSFSPSGSGTFSPTARSISITFVTTNTLGWSGTAGNLFSIDNVTLAKPAYYVSPTGNDRADGLTEQTAFQTLQRASDVSQPGDIILVQGGTYTATGDLLSVTNGGTPGNWVTFKNYPGQTPVLRTQGWNTIKIGAGSSSAIYTGPAIGYVEVRGFNIRGYADDPTVGSNARSLDAAGQFGELGSNSAYNTNGVTVEGRWSTTVPHHIRIADNKIELVSGGGVAVLEADRVQIENNVVRNTSYWTTYATSGISILSASYFDTSAGYHRLVTNNESSGNRTNIRWVATGYPSDGNGIILDYNFTSPDRPSNTAYGRTLVANNVTYFNGGSGIHAFNARHVDILNNVAYLNGQASQGSGGDHYGQIFAGSYGVGMTIVATGTAGSITSSYSGQGVADVNIANNILVAPSDAPAGQPFHPLTYNYTSAADVAYENDPANRITYRNNVYWGGEVVPPDANSNGNIYADPLFVNPSTDPATADFRLRAFSPAIDRSVPSYSYSNATYGLPTIINWTSPYVALVDPNVAVPNPVTTTVRVPYAGIDGRTRDAVADAGAYEFSSAGGSDIGGSSPRGSTVYSGGTYTVSGGGSDIWGTSDQFHYSSQSVSGDQTLTARITSQTNTDGWAKAGLMFRGSAAAGSAFVAVELTPANGIHLQSRGVDGGSATDVASTAGGVGTWLRLVRSGKNFTAFTSADGLTWTSFGTVQADFTNTGYLAGLAVTSHNVNSASAATFTNVVLAAANLGLPSGWTAGDVGGSVPAGVSSRNNSVFTVSGGGTDIWGTSDQFQYAYQPASGDQTLTARITSLTNTNEWAKAGVMFRNSAAPGAAYVAVELTGANGIQLQYRNADGASAVGGISVWGSAGVWVRLVKSGSTFTGYTSSDGANWASFGTAQVGFTNSSYLAGLAVTSHNTSTLATATFSNVSVTSNRATGGTAAASSEPIAGQTGASAFDGSVTTKWLGSFGPASTWLGYQFGGGASYAVSRYAITSADDAPLRDPAAWTLQGSNNGTDWTDLDTRTGQSFAARYTTNTYDIPNTTAYSYYRLLIKANNGSTETGLGGSGLVQISELSLFA